MPVGAVVEHLANHGLHPDGFAMQPVSEPVGRDVSTMVPDQAQLHTADGLPAFPPDQTERRQGDYSDEDEQVQPLLKLTIRIPFLHSAASSGDAERV